MIFFEPHSHTSFCLYGTSFLSLSGRSYSLEKVCWRRNILACLNTIYWKVICSKVALESRVEQGYKQKHKFFDITFFKHCLRFLRKWAKVGRWHGSLKYSGILLLTNYNKLIKCFTMLYNFLFWHLYYALIFKGKRTFTIPKNCENSRI